MLLSALMLVLGLAFLGYHWSRERRMEKIAADIAEDEEEYESKFSDIMHQATGFLSNTLISAI